MRRNPTSIPVKPLAEEHEVGIVVVKISSDQLQSFEEVNHSHRHNYHIFLLAQQGNVHIEIDFQQYCIKAPAVLYIHPNQVHRLLKFENIDFYLLGMNSETIHSDYLNALEQSIAPAQPLSIKSEIIPVFNQTLSLCSTIFERKIEKLPASLLKDYCNAFVGLAVSQYMEQSMPVGSLSRFEIVTKAFIRLLEQNFTRMKRPSAYAGALHISTPYLNECVSNVTGFSVSHQIQQRIILEAKRLLYHSGKSVKEIASELGYADYAYFSRLFAKTAGMTALTFRSKNLD
jgi:AraC-like DNA-binding protein/quercetin dioxygenase-like cupin family protein